MTFLLGDFFKNNVISKVFNLLITFTNYGPKNDTAQDTNIA